MVIDIFNTDKKYDIIYADPPWSYRDKMKMKGVHGEIRGAASFYDTMDLSDIKSLPIKSIAKENSILFMWITMPMLDKAFQVMETWGFTYKTCGFCWIKRTKNGKIHLGEVYLPFVILFSILHFQYFLHNQQLSHFQ